MRQVFADSFYFLALINRKDSNHARVKAYGRPPEPLLTTQAVLFEVGDALTADHHFAQAGFVPLLAD